MQKQDKVNIEAEIKAEVKHIHLSFWLYKITFNLNYSGSDIKFSRVTISEQLL